MERRRDMKTHYWIGDERMKKTCRIPYILAGLVSAFATGLLFTWSYFRTPLNELFPTWTSADLSMIFSVHNMAVCTTMILCGTVVKKISPKVRMVLAAVLIVAGLGCFPLLPQNNPDAAFQMAFILYAIVAPIGAGIAAITWMGNFVLWVPERPGLMSGGMLFLYNSCPFVYGALSSMLIPAVGILTTVRMIGVISGVLLVCCLPFMRAPKAEDGLPMPKTTAVNRTDRSYTTLQMLKTPIFWAMFIFNVSMRSAGLIFADHSAGIAMSFGVAALFGMIYAPANGSASFVSGLLVDRIGSANTMRLFSLILLAASVLLFISGFSAIAIVALIGLIGAGFAFGGTSAANSTTVRLFFGPEYYTQNYSTTTFSIFFASVSCYLAGIVVDRIGRRLLWSLHHDIGIWRDRTGLYAPAFRLYSEGK